MSDFLFTFVSSEKQNIMSTQKSSSIILISLLAIMLSVLRGYAVDYKDIYDIYRNTPLDELCDIGERHLAENHRDSALAFFTLVRTQLNNDKNAVASDAFARSENCIGIISFMNGDYTKAYACFRRVLESDKTPVSSALINMAGIYHYFGDDKKSAEMLRDIIHNPIHSKDARMASTALTNMMSLGFTASRPDMISEYRNDILAYLDKFGDNDDKSTYYTRPYARAMLAAGEKQWPEAIDLLRKSLLFTDSMLLPPRNVVATELALGNCFLQINSTDSAISHFNIAKQVAADNGYSELLNETFDYFSAAYERKGDKYLSGVYRFRYFKMKDSLFNTVEFGRLRDLQTSYDIDKFEKEVNRLNMEERFHSRVIVIVSVAMALISAMLLVLFRQNRLLKRKNRDIYNKYVMMINEKDNLHGSDDCDQSEESRKYAGPSLNDNVRMALKNRIAKVMADEDMVCNEGFSLDSLASACESNSTYVSQVLNEDFGKSFTRMLNEARVEIVSRRLMDTESNGKLTIEAISASAGFKSRSNFSRTFKAITGLTPTEFLKESKSRHRSSSGPLESH